MSKYLETGMNSSFKKESLFTSGDFKEFQHLVTFLKLSKNKGFKLAFIKCNTKLLEEEIRDRYKGVLSSLGIEPIEVVLRGETTDLLEKLKRLNLQQFDNKCIFVYGLDYSIAEVKEEQPPILAHLNLARDSFKRYIHCPLILSLSDESLRKLSAYTPDFYSWKVAVFEFEGRRIPIFPYATPELRLSEVKRYKKDEEEKIKEYETIIQQYKKLFKPDETYANLLIKVGEFYTDRFKLDKAENYIRQALDICKEIRDKNKELDALIALGNIYLRLSRYDEAMNYYILALEISEQLGDIHSMAIAYGNIGNVYMKKGEWDKALEFYQKDLEMSEQLKDIHGMAVTWGNMGVVYEDKGEWNKALEFYKKSLEIKEQVSDIYGMAITYNNMGLVYQAKGEWDTALEFYERSLEIYEQVGDVYSMAQTFNNKGLLYQAKGEWDMALEFYEKSLKIYEQVGDIHGMAVTWTNMGVLEMKRGNNKKAAELLEEAIVVFEKFNDVINLKNVRCLLDQIQPGVRYLKS